MKSFISYLKNVQGELKHVVWPKPRQALIHTGLIVLMSAIVAIFIGLVDYGLTSIVNVIISNR